jgi:hypothetical protein
MMPDREDSDQAYSRGTRRRCRPTPAGAMAGADPIGAKLRPMHAAFLVMAGLDPAICTSTVPREMAGSSPAMTRKLGCGPLNLALMEIVPAAWSSTVRRLPVDGELSLPAASYNWP